MQKFLLSTALALSVAQAHAAGLAVGAGSSVDFGNATMGLGCGDLAVAGSVNANGASLTSLGPVDI